MMYLFQSMFMLFNFFQ